MRLGLVGRRRLLVLGGVGCLVAALRLGPALDRPAPSLRPPRQPVVAAVVAPSTSATTSTAPTVPATAHPLGLVSRGEFVVDPLAPLPSAVGPFAPVPEDPAGRYSFGMSPQGGGRFAPVLPENRCLRADLAAVVQHIALRFAALFGPDGVHLVVGEGNSAGDHATHYGGAYVDLYTDLADGPAERFVGRDGGPGPYVARLPLVRNFLRVGGQLDYEDSLALWVMMAVVDSGRFGRVVYESDVVDDLAEGYAAVQGVPFAADPIRWSGNRTHFYHLHLEAEPLGESRSCEP